MGFGDLTAFFREPTIYLFRHWWTEPRKESRLPRNSLTKRSIEPRGTFSLPFGHISWTFVRESERVWEILYLIYLFVFFFLFVSLARFLVPNGTSQHLYDVLLSFHAST